MPKARTRLVNFRVTDEEFKRMSAAERLDYTRKFDQRQFQNNGRAA